MDQHQALVDVVRYLTEPFRVIARLAGVVFDVVWSDHLTVSNGHAASDLLTSATYGVGPMPDKALQLQDLAMVKRNMVTARVTDNEQRSLLSIRCAYLSLFIASISILLAVILAPLSGKQQFLSRESLDHRQLNVELQPRLAPGSYRNDTRMEFDNISLPWRGTARSTANTVAVVLNWSRFENVRRIASVLCSPELDPIIEHVLVWNNNPKPLTYLVRHMVALSRLFYCIDVIIRIFCRPPVQKKNYGSSTLPRICTSLRDS